MTERLFAILICWVISAVTGSLGSAFAQAKDCGAGNLVPETEFCLAGTTVIGSGGVAIFKTKNQTLSVATGETVGNWRVTAVKSGAITIQRGEVSRQLAVNRISAAAPIVPRRAPVRELHDISPVAAGKAASVGTVSPSGKRLSISSHLPPVQEY